MALPNILQLQDDLKGMSQDQLQAEMEAPSGIVPQYLVLGEMDRRAKMEQAYLAASNSPKTTVAEDAMSGGGISSVMAQDMGNTLNPGSEFGASGEAAPLPQEDPMAPPPPMAEIGMAEGGWIPMAQGGKLPIVVKGERIFPDDPRYGAFVAQGYHPAAQSNRPRSLMQDLPEEEGWPLDDGMYLDPDQPVDPDRMETERLQGSRRLDPSDKIDPFSELFDTDPSRLPEVSMMDYLAREDGHVQMKRPEPGSISRDPIQGGRAPFPPGFGTVGGGAPSENPELGGDVDLASIAPFGDAPVGRMVMPSLQGGFPDVMPIDVRDPDVEEMATGMPAPMGDPMQDQGPGFLSQLLGANLLPDEADKIPVNWGRNLMSAPPSEEDMSGFSDEQRELYDRWFGDRDVAQQEIRDTRARERDQSLPTDLSFGDDVPMMDPGTVGDIGREDTIPFMPGGMPEDNETVTQLPPPPPAPPAGDKVRAPADNATRVETGAAAGTSRGGASTAPAGQIPRIVSEREQQKWLAWARIGLNLMASDAPSLGQALGEAGLEGLNAYQEAMQYMDAKEAAMAKAAAGARGRGSSSSSSSGKPKLKVNDALSRAEDLMVLAQKYAPNEAAGYEGNPAQFKFLNNLAMELYAGAGYGVDPRYMDVPPATPEEILTP